MSILQRIKERAQQQPQKLAYCVENEKITYAQLWQGSEQVAQAILARNITTPIIVYGHFSPLQLIAFLGVAKAGQAYIPVDTSIPLERLQYIIETAKAQLILTSEPLTIEGDFTIQAIANLVDGAPCTVSEENWLAPDETFYIIFTSGSTGNPKGVQISADNLWQFTQWMHKNFPLQEGVFLNQAPFSFDLSVMDIYPALTSGNTLYALTQAQLANPKDLFTTLEQSNISIWTSTPSFAKICLMNPQWQAATMPNLKTFLFCGEVLSVSLAKQLFERFPEARIFNLYGPTETTVAVSFVEVTPTMLTTYDKLPIAQAKQLQLVEDEIVITGATVSKGYLGQPQLTAKSFKEGSYYTGDLGYLADDYIFYTGRADFQIKMHGYRMELEEIEKQIEQLADVASCIVLPVKQGDEVVALTANIVLYEPLSDKPFHKTKQLKEQLKAYLPSYMVPKKFIYLDALPLNANGKVDRKGMAVAEGL